MNTTIAFLWVDFAVDGSMQVQVGILVEYDLFARKSQIVTYENSAVPINHRVHWTQRVLIHKIG